MSEDKISHFHFHCRLCLNDKFKLLVDDEGGIYAVCTKCEAQSFIADMDVQPQCDCCGKTETEGTEVKN